MKKYSVLMSVFAFLLSLNSTLAIGIGTSSSCLQGTVSDVETGQPLAGANVFLEHTTVGAASDLEGAFSIENPPAGKQVLVVAMIGFEAQRREIDLPSTHIMNFQLTGSIMDCGVVVVTATSTPRLFEDVPVKTEIVSRPLIELTQAVNLAEALTMQTGVRVENNCQNCNFSQVRIHGLDGKYSQILVDGDPVVSSLAGVYGLEHFPEGMIEQIEIVKGGGSSLYGGGAVAGIVNLITRRPYFNGTTIKYLGQSLEGTSGDNQFSLYSSVVHPESKMSAYIFASARKRNSWDANADGFSELGELSNQSLGFNFYYSPVTNSELKVHFHHIHEERRGGNKFDRPFHEADIAEAVEHNRWGGSLQWSQRATSRFDYRLFYSLALQKRDSYYGGLGGNTQADTLEALTFYGRTDNPLHVFGAHFNWTIGNHLLTAGSEYITDYLNDKSTVDPIYYIDQKNTNIGVFLQDNLYFGSNRRFDLTAGVRMDKHSELTDPVFSPRVTGMYSLTDNITARATISTGFKAPQIFDEDLHLCGLAGDQKIIRNSADLQEENSLSYSGGIEYRGRINDMPIELALSGFHTDISNVFSERYVGYQDNLEIWERINHDGAQVSGVEFDLGFSPSRFLELRGGYTCKQSRYDLLLDDFDTRDFLRTPESYGHLRMIGHFSRAIRLFAACRYTGEAQVPHAIAVPDSEDPELVLEYSDTFLVADLGLSYKFPGRSNYPGSNTMLSLGVKNIANAFQEDLDVGVNRDPAYVFGPSQPRTFYLGMEVSF